MKHSLKTGVAVLIVVVTPACSGTPDSDEGAGSPGTGSLAQGRDEMLAETLSEMQSMDPESLQDGNVLSSEMIDHVDADRIMWKITWDTSSK